MNLLRSVCKRWLSDYAGKGSREIAQLGIQSLEPSVIQDIAMSAIVEELDKQSRRNVVRFRADMTRTAGRSPIDRAAGDESDGRTVLQRLSEAMAQALNELKQSVHIELTTRELAQTFAMGDGSRVSWGDATIAQHRARIAMLHAAMTSSMEVIARHELAAETLSVARVSSLNRLRATGREAIGAPLDTQNAAQVCTQ